MKQIFLLLTAILIVMAYWIILDTWVAYRAEAVQMTASVPENPCSRCLELCR